MATRWKTTELLLSEYQYIVCVCVCVTMYVSLYVCVNHACLFRSKLTNDDFRKLLMTPRATPSSAPPSKSRHHEWVTKDRNTPAIRTEYLWPVMMIMMMKKEVTDCFVFPECQETIMKMRILQREGGRRRGESVDCIIIILTDLCGVSAVCLLNEKLLLNPTQTQLYGPMISLAACVLMLC